MVPDGMPDTSKPLAPEFFINPRCPLGTVPTEAVSINVHPREAANVAEREALAAVLETDNNKAGEHLFAAEVGPGNEPDSSVRITEEINEPDVSCVGPAFCSCSSNPIPTPMFCTPGSCCVETQLNNKACVVLSNKACVVLSNKACVVL